MSVASDKSIKLWPLIVLIAPLGALSDGCGSLSMCSKLNQPLCIDTPSKLCGCFELVKMRGGFAGGDYDPHDNGIYEAIILRPEGRFELYRSDTLAWYASFEIIRPENKKGKQNTKLKLVDRHGKDLNYRLSFEDDNHIWLGEMNAIDSFSFLFIRR